MNERSLMRTALLEYFVPKLEELGFEGEFPHYKRITKKRIELLSISFDKFGGAFSVIISYALPGIENSNILNTFNKVSVSELNTFHTSERLTLPSKGLIRFCDTVQLDVNGNREMYSLTDAQKNIFLKNLDSDSYIIEKVNRQEIYKQSAELAVSTLDQAFEWWKKQPYYKLYNSFFKRIYKKFFKKIDVT